MKTTSLAKVAWAGLFLSSVAAVAKDFEFTVKAEVPTWQDSGYTLAKDEYVEIRAKGEWITSHPPLKFGPSGEQEKAPDKPWAAPGMRAGCLIVALKNGNEAPSVKGWEKDDDVVTFKGPGKLYFMANDEPRQADYGQSPGRFLWIEFGAPKTIGGGFSDNSGELQIAITIKKNH